MQGAIAESAKNAHRDYTMIENLDPQQAWDCYKIIPMPC